MARAFPLLLRATALLVGLTLTQAAAAGGSAKEAERRASNTFSLLVTAPAVKSGPSGSPSNGVGIGPTKPVVSNPYNVPLLQNAGSLRSGR